MIPTAHVSQKCGHIIQYNAREHACDDKTNQHFIVCYGYWYRQPSQGTITWYSLQVLKLLLPAIIHRFVSHIMEIRLVCYSRRHQWQHDTLKGGGGGTKDERGENREHLSRAHETTRYRISMSEVNSVLQVQCKKTRHAYSPFKFNEKGMLCVVLLI